VKTGILAPRGTFSLCPQVEEGPLYKDTSPIHEGSPLVAELDVGVRQVVTEPDG
jgi:hypothetical protein